jgi:hypothetical protein
MSAIEIDPDKIIEIDPDKIYGLPEYMLWKG